MTELNEKAATPDDVREAVEYIETYLFGNGKNKDRHFKTLINAALRQPQSVSVIDIAHVLNLASAADSANSKQRWIDKALAILNAQAGE